MEMNEVWKDNKPEEKIEKFNSFFSSFNPLSFTRLLVSHTLMQTWTSPFLYFISTTLEKAWKAYQTGGHRRINFVSKILQLLITFFLEKNK